VRALTRTASAECTPSPNHTRNTAAAAAAAADDDDDDDDDAHLPAVCVRWRAQSTPTCALALLPRHATQLLLLLMLLLTHPLRACISALKPLPPAPS
jgi:hypothetical protein